MGIKHLHQLISDQCPNAVKASEIKNFFGRKVAILILYRSMSIYQFMIAVRQQDGQQLMSETGETTRIEGDDSHLMGMFYRTLRIIDNGIKPCYVFDGAPPKLKNGELAKRYAKREEAAKASEEAKEIGTVEEIDKFSRRTVKVTREHNEECKRLLKLMGVPYVTAPCEAEAQCAALAKAGKVYAAASEDMDTLTFRTPILLRHLTFSEQRKIPISEIDLEKVLTGLDMSYEEFVDLCILLGCDYCDPIKGIGPQTALRLLKQHKSIDKILSSNAIDTSKHPLPERYPYADARELFLNPEVADPETLEIKWGEPDVEGLVDFLVREKGFSEERVRTGAARLSKGLKTKQQGRLEGFFKVLPKSPQELAKQKRKAEEDAAAKKAAKKGKTNAGGGGGGRGRPK